MRKPSKVCVLGLAGLSLAFVAGCNSKSSTSTPQPSSPPVSTASAPSSDADALLIHGFAYNTLTVKPGATVTVTNSDQAEHTVTSSPKGAFDVDVEKGSPKTFTAPSAPGTYNIICKFHASMHGTIIVKA